MNDKEAIELASSYAEQQGYNVTQYDVSVKKDKNEWLVHFQGKNEGKKHPPGNFFTVYIDDKLVLHLFPGK